MPLRVLHCPTNVGNHPQGLARAERRLGLDSRCVELEPGWLAYPVDDPAPSSPLALEAKRWRVLAEALRRYDVIHFNFGRSLMPTAAPTLLDPSAGLGDAVHVPGRLYARSLALRDVALLRRAGKAIAVTFQGDDARQATGPDVPAPHRRLRRDVEAGYYTDRGDRRKRRAIALFSRHADLIYYLNPDLGFFFPARARFVPYAHVDPSEWAVTAERRRPAVPTIVHAPSHRGIKGTRHIVEAIARLRRSGREVDFQLVEGLPHDEARKLYEQADVVVDQLLVGWYGGLAVEAMALGKPVVGYIDDEVARRFAPAGLVRDLPLLRATPDTLHAVLEQVLTVDDDAYAELSRRSRAFVETWHDSTRIAGGLVEDYESVFAGRSASRAP